MIVIPVKDNRGQHDTQKKRSPNYCITDWGEITLNKEHPSADITHLQVSADFACWTMATTKFSRAAYLGRFPFSLKV